MKDAPRGIEKVGILKVRGMVFHFHHGYLGVILLLGQTVDWTKEIAIALIVSDALFHLTAKLIWNDPLWD
jgi:hypothetical protein